MKKNEKKVEGGDICALVGVENLDIGDTLADFEHPEALPPIAIDEPTVSMLFRVNDSPLFGQDGKFISSRHIRERLFKEAERDVALKVEEETASYGHFGREGFPWENTDKAEALKKEVQ